MPIEEFQEYIPTVKIQLFFQAESDEHYDLNDILVDSENWTGGILYQFYIKNSKDLLIRVKSILKTTQNDKDIRMSLLPIELYDYSITVPGKGNNVSYDTLTKFRSVELPAERDNFASNADKLGSKALSDILQKQLTTESFVKIEKAYSEFFETIKKEGNLENVLNWQEYSEINNAKDFFQRISILPNMPQMSSILGSIRLGYEEENMFMQGLGHRNLILMTVLLNSFINKPRDVHYRLMTVEEPEAHLCISNTLLMTSLLNLFCNKNKYIQIVYSTHNVEFVNKIGLDKVIVLHNGEAISLDKELNDAERDYLSANPNTDIFKLLYSKKVILVEGLTEELLIKSYLQTKNELNDIKILSLHKGFTKIIDIWKKLNVSSGNKLGIVRDYDNQPKAQFEHEIREDGNVIVRTTEKYTMETEITEANYNLLKNKYGDKYGWSNMSKDDLQKNWREKKSDVMLQICHDLVNGKLDDFVLPSHIQVIIDFMQGNNSEN